MKIYKDDGPMPACPVMVMNKLTDEMIFLILVRNVESGDEACRLVTAGISLETLKETDADIEGLTLDDIYVCNLPFAELHHGHSHDEEN